MSGFIEVNKVSREKLIVNDGSNVKNPLSEKEGRKAVYSDKWLTQVEGIRVDQIKSYRIWDKDINQEAYIEGDVTIIYMLSDDKSKKQPPTIMIEESFRSFGERLSAIKLEAIHA